MSNWSLPSEIILNLIRCFCKERFIYFSVQWWPFMVGNVKKKCKTAWVPSDSWIAEPMLKSKMKVSPPWHPQLLIPPSDDNLLIFVFTNAPNMSEPEWINKNALLHINNTKFSYFGGWYWSKQGRYPKP